MSWWHKFLSSLAALAPNCRAAARAQSDALEAPLAVARRLGLRLHLLMCKWCRRYGEQLRFLHSSAHVHEEKLTGAGAEGLTADARKRIKEKLQQEP